MNEKEQKMEVDKDTSTDMKLENHVEGTQEAQEGTLRVEDVSMSGLGEKAPGGADTAVTQQNAILGSGVEKKSAIKSVKTQKKYGKGLVIGFLVLLMVIGVGFGVTGMILWWQEKQELEQLRNQSPEVTERIEVVREDGETITIETESGGENERRVKEVVGKFTEKLQEWVQIEDKYGQIITPSFLTLYDSVEGLDSVLVYRPSGLQISVILDRSYGVRWDLSGLIDNATVYSRALDVVVSDDLLAKGTQWLESQGFSRYDNPAAAGYTYLNYNSGVICTLSTSYPGMLLNCGHIGWFDSKVAEFSNQIAVSSGFEEGWILRINPESLTIKDSAYAPYQTMRADGFLSGYMFYRTSPDESWQWFREWSTQALADCSDYNTDDLKRAFLGDICGVEDGRGRVEL